MHLVRVVAVGSLIAAAIMLATAHPFFAFIQATDAIMFGRNVLAMDPDVPSTVGAVGVAVFLFLAIGAGLFLSALLYAPIDRFLADMFSAGGAAVVKEVAGSASIHNAPRSPFDVLRP